MQDIYEALGAIKAGGAVVYPLFVLGIIALVIIVDKIYVYSRFMQLPESIEQLIESYGFDWAALETSIHNLGSNNYYSRFIGVIIQNKSHPAWWVESRANDESQLIEKALNRYLWILETIVTAAPLLGLLGTITGMMHSFELFGGSGLVDPTGVTGGVAQALIATGIGLFIAIIALFAFNYFSKQQAEAMDELERLGTRLLDSIRMAEEKGNVIPKGV